jgi:hypothetical protein
MSSYIVSSELSAIQDLIAYLNIHHRADDTPLTFDVAVLDQNADALGRIAYTDSGEYALVLA